jgi:hypothetical protein
MYLRLDWKYSIAQNMLDLNCTAVPQNRALLINTLNTHRDFNAAFSPIDRPSPQQWETCKPLDLNLLYTKDRHAREIMQARADLAKYIAYEVENTILEQLYANDLIEGYPK